MGDCRVEIADSGGLIIRNEEPSKRNTIMLNALKAQRAMLCTYKASADYAREIMELCFHGFSHYARKILILGRFRSTELRMKIT